MTSTGTASSIFGYAGEQLDTTGLVYLRARYMQPTLGIFLARDPWNGDQMRPGSMNGWNYAENDPILYADPSGKEKLPPNLAQTRCLSLGFGYSKNAYDWCLNYLIIEDHDALRSEMLQLVWLAWLKGDHIAAENLSHYLSAAGTDRVLSSQWYLENAGGSDIITAPGSGQISTVTALEARRVGDQLRQARLDSSLPPCTWRAFDGNSGPNGVYAQAEDIQLALGGHIIYGRYYDDSLCPDSGCSCNERYYVGFWVDDPYAFTEPKGPEFFKYPLAPVQIPFTWLNDLTTAHPPRAKVFHSKIYWVEEIDTRANKKIYHYDVDIRTNPVPPY